VHNYEEHAAENPAATQGIDKTRVAYERSRVTGLTDVTVVGGGGGSSSGGEGLGGWWTGEYPYKDGQTRELVTSLDLNGVCFRVVCVSITCAFQCEKSVCQFASVLEISVCVCVITYPCADMCLQNNTHVNRCLQDLSPEFAYVQEFILRIHTGVVLRI